MKHDWTKGLLRENPIFILLLGMCPTLAVSTSAANGIGMGLSATVVLLASNASISAVKALIPDQVRIPAYITLIATFVTILEYLLHAYLPALYDSLGIFIPLIVVNCIILGRAEAFAARNRLVPSVIDGLTMGLGFTLALTILGSIREVLGAGALFGIPLIPKTFNITGFILPPGAFITLGFLIAGAGLIRQAMARRASNRNPD